MTSSRITVPPNSLKKLKKDSAYLVGTRESQRSQSGLWTRLLRLLHLR